MNIIKFCNLLIKKIILECVTIICIKIKEKKNYELYCFSYFICDSLNIQIEYVYILSF